MNVWKKLGTGIVCLFLNISLVFAEDGCDASKDTQVPEEILYSDELQDFEPSRLVYIGDNGQRDCRYAYDCGLNGVWLPEDPILFKPFIADPRQITYSVGWRFYDQVLSKNVIDVSYGDSFGLYEWYAVTPWGGKLRIDLEGALWAVFAPLQESSPLINADYYVGIPVTYAVDCWQFRWRVFHISSHIGDEFLIKHAPRGFRRLNPSAEYTDISVSHELTDDIRVYAVLGAMLHQDESFRCGYFYAEGGMELRLRGLQHVDTCNRIFRVPFLGMHFRYNKVFKNHVDATYVIGYEWAKFYGLCRRLRVFMEYHDGYSAEGQFCHFATNYLSFRVSYGF